MKAGKEKLARIRLLQQIKTKNSPGNDLTQRPRKKTGTEKACVLFWLTSSTQPLCRTQKTETHKNSPDVLDHAFSTCGCGSPLILFTVGLALFRVAFCGGGWPAAMCGCVWRGCGEGTKPLFVVAVDVPAACAIDWRKAPSVFMFSSWGRFCPT